MLARPTADGKKMKTPPRGGASMFLYLTALAVLLTTLLVTTLLLLAGFLLSATLLTTLLLTTLLLLAGLLVRVLILIHFHSPTWLEAL
jgi:hypothetical protein